MLCFLFQQLDQAALSLAVREDYLDNSTEAKSVSFPHSTLHLVRHCEVHKCSKIPNSLLEWSSVGV